MQRILLAGGSGLIGGFILQRLLASGEHDIIAPTRRPLALSGPRLRVPVGDWNDPACSDDLRIQLRASTAGGPLTAFVCALGTTLKTAGSKAAFRAVDFDLVLRMATLARELGAGHAIIVSSVGAHAKSANFYLSVKGQVENAVQALGFARLDLLRPSMLIGDRTELRMGESVAKALAPLFNPLLFGALRRYRAIRADTVAAKACALLTQTTPGCVVHEYDSLRDSR